ncbi:trehalose 6-phosphate phosphorylase [Wenjunlia vitaminophila]|uniref:Trehalose 6-phosphate phosphorylase n=1 Tax=Wenjunlia vitaminophila TaxID=76728 RepID=A0A0T6LWW4_WENVI|nr:glycosyl hydrolase family 65 protein [Wenjunlia vitaminophila]KRV50512.1 trehalose 6-phosphate phosphorylase [Wenjunlia vitaminophila]
MSRWTWEYEGYRPEDEGLRESLCTLGNGYFATRGACPEAAPGPHHYPGTYVAGCYNRLVSDVAGRAVENEDLVNLPNWLPLRFRVLPPDDRPAEGPIERGADTAWLSPDGPGLLDYRQTLDLRGGTLTRRMTYRDPYGRLLRVEQTRLVHMGDPHVAALHTVFSADDWSGTVEVECTLDGTVTNHGVARYRDLEGRHLNGVQTGMHSPETAWLRCRTTTSGITVALASRVRGTDGAGPTPVFPRLMERRATQRTELAVGKDQPSVVEKVVALHTSRDTAVSDPLRAALEEVELAPDFATLLASHRAAWRHLWQRNELDVPGEAGHILRLHLFHVLQTLSPHTAELDVGVPARGLHGEAYRGHVFWDELFVLPYLNLHLPEVSKALLTYRHRRLRQACRAAREAGYAGARYPWQSGSDGREETQRLHLNPRSGRWLPDHSRLQHHVGSAVAYNVWQYSRASGDVEFLHTKGAEMLTQIARHWAALAAFDPEVGRYRIRGVMGPDEYHDGYPDAERPGVNDNAYTNVTASWVLQRALELAATLPEPRRRELFERIGLEDGELDRWAEVAHGLYVPFHRGVISQFDGYGDLLELDWDGYRRRYGDIRRLDRILEAEGDTVNRYQASKQADVLMLGYLFAPEELAGLMRSLGHRLDDDDWHRTVDYYLARTSHGSTLSGLVHGWVLARERRVDAWQYVLEALAEDVADVQGGTTAEGIHLGAMGGTLDLVQRGLTGLEGRTDGLWLNPAPLPEMSEFSFSIRYRGHWGVGVRLCGNRVRVSVPASEQLPIRVVLDGQAEVIAPGDAKWLEVVRQ